MEQNNELSKSNKFKIIVLVALVFIVAVSGITYAYFTIQVNGNDTASSIRITAADLSLVYNDVQVRSGEYIDPGWSSEPKTLTVYNDGNTIVYYNIIWRDLYNEITNDELVIEATCVSSSGTCSNITETIIPTETTLAHNISVKNNIEIAVGETHTYTLTAIFKDTGSNQNYNKNKDFYGTLNISEGVNPSNLSPNFTILNSTANTQGITNALAVGDLVSITSGNISEEFYVVSSNSSQTFLLAKYNLLVGDVVDFDENDGYIHNRTLTQLSDSGYGLQSSTAKGAVWLNGETQYIGVVPFSGTNYWHNSSTNNIFSKYGTYTNDANNIYDASLNSVAPSINYTTFEVAENNYTIAYYVEQYINTLNINGTAGLLTVEQLDSLGCDLSQFSCEDAPAWLNNGSSFWLATANNAYGVNLFTCEGFFGSDGGNFDNITDLAGAGVRPVIAVSTSDLLD